MQIGVTKDDSGKILFPEAKCPRGNTFQIRASHLSFLNLRAFVENRSAKIRPGQLCLG